jgi:hypothetical protein
VPTLKLTAGKPASTRTARTKPAAKRSAPKTTPARSKPAAKKVPARKSAAKATPVQENGAQTRGPKLPEGWTQRDFNTLVKQMEDARTDKEAAQEALAEAQTAVNELALDAIAEGIQMSVVSETLKLSRQRLYDLMEKADVKTERQATNPHPNKGLTQEEIEAKAAKAARKPAAKRTAPKPAAKRASTRKPAAKRAPARKPPARKPAASGNGSGRVRIRARA